MGVVGGVGAAGGKGVVGDVRAGGVVGVLGVVGCDSGVVGGERVCCSFCLRFEFA